MRYTFPAGARLRRRRDFQRVHRQGVRLQVFPLRIWYCKRPGAGGSRLGLAIGRRAGTAAVRNRWKRAVREAFRRHRHALSTPGDIVVSVSWRSGKKDVAKTEEAFLKAIALMNDV